MNNVSTVEPTHNTTSPTTMSPKISSVKSVWTNREARTWIVLTLTFGALIALLVNAVVATTDTSPSSDVVSTSTLAL